MPATKHEIAEISVSTKHELIHSALADVQALAKDADGNLTLGKTARAREYLAQVQLIVAATIAANAAPTQANYDALAAAQANAHTALFKDEPVTVEYLMQQGVSRADAEAALKKISGS